VPPAALTTIGSYAGCNDALSAERGRQVEADEIRAGTGAKPLTYLAMSCRMVACGALCLISGCAARGSAPSGTRALEIAECHRRADAGPAFWDGPSTTDVVYLMHTDAARVAESVAFPGGIIVRADAPTNAIVLDGPTEVVRGAWTTLARADCAALGVR
jgi:hypothetical protein